MFDVIHQWIRLNELYKLMKSFFFPSFELVFEFVAKNQKNFKMDSEVWILIKVQCVIYQCIWLNKLYKLMERFLILK